MVVKVLTMRLFRARRQAGQAACCAFSGEGGICQGSGNFTLSPSSGCLELKKLIFCKCLQPQACLQSIYVWLKQTEWTVERISFIRWQEGEYRAFLTSRIYKSWNVFLTSRTCKSVHAPLQEESAVKWFDFGWQWMNWVIEELFFLGCVQRQH